MTAWSTGFTQRGSTTVTPMPWSFSRRATSTQVTAIGPAPSSSTSRPCSGPGSASTSIRPSLPTASASTPTAPLGQRTTVGPSLTSTASLTSSATRLPSRGAATRRPGTTCRIEPSHMPLWLAPSGPVTPARSRVTVTGSLCSATSISSWSNARFRNVA